MENNKLKMLLTDKLLEVEAIKNVLSNNRLRLQPVKRLLGIWLIATRSASVPPANLWAFPERRNGITNSR